MFNSKVPVTLEPPAPAMPVSGVPGGPGYAPESEVHFLDRLTVLYRYKSIVFAVMATVFIGGAVQTYTTTKEYSSISAVQVDPDRPAVPGLGGGFMLSTEDDDYMMATELERLHSHKLARRVAAKLDLAHNPEFNGAENPPSGLGDAVLGLRKRLTDPLMALFRGKPTPTAIKATVPVPQTDTKTQDMNSDMPPETADEAARVERLMAHTNVEAQLGARIFRIKVDSRHPEFAAQAANAYAYEYVAQNLRNKTFTLQNKREQALKSADLKKQELEDAKKLYQTALEKSPGGFLDATTFAAIVGQARQSWTTAQTEAAEARARYENLAKIDLKDPEAANLSPIFAGDARVAAYQGDIQEQLKQKKTLMDTQHMLENHPTIVALNSQIESTRRQLQARLVNILENARQAYDMAQATETRYKNQYDSTTDMASQKNAASIPIDLLKSDVDRKQAVLDDLQKQAEVAQVEMSAVANNARVLDNAQVPSTPFKPNAANNMLIALVGGFVLALGLAFGLDYLDDTVKTPEDITKKLHVPFLGLVPSVRGDKQPVLSGPVPHDFGESYRALRTSLVFTSGGESTRVITVTSAQPLEGKTTTACNLAMVLAFGGSRVLLIDADMRRPGVHKALKINNTVGLSHLLVGQARVREAIQRTSDPNFCVMTAGRTPPNPSELLSSERMRQLVANLKQGPFDWVIIDTPPVLAVTDAIILTPLVDGVTFVVGAEMTRRRLAERAVHMVMASRPRVVGAVLNRVNFDRNKYYYSRYYGYQYKSYYGTNTNGVAATE